MKNETIAKDITTTLELTKATDAETKARRELDASITAGTHQPQALGRAIAARNAHLAAQAALKRIPAPRRTLAASIIPTAERIGGEAAHLGSEYSGETCYRVNWATMADATTTTSRGEQYSRGCTFRKTDVDHIVTLDPAGVAALVEAEPLRTLSARDGLPLIALYPDNRAVWVRSKGKAITAERGWIVGNAAVCYHSTKSREHAQKGFERKHAAHLKDLRERRLTHKEARRAALVARLCHHATATIGDARAMGYCTPGIQSFQSRHGIGDEATLPQLVKTGDPSAVRLALKIARSVRREAATPALATT